VEFFADNILLGARTNCLPCASIQNPFCLMWSNVPPGNYVLTARATDNRGAASVSEPVEIAVVHAPPPVVTIRATDPNASEPGVLTVIDSGEFTITRSYGTNVPLTVYFSIGGTAGNGVDYFAISSSTVIPAGQLSTKVMVYPKHDTIPEPTETVVLKIEPPVCIAIYPPPYECYQVGAPREAVVYIADNDTATNLPPKVAIAKPLDGQTFVAPVKIPIPELVRFPEHHVFEKMCKPGNTFFHFITGTDTHHDIKRGRAWTVKWYSDHIKTIIQAMLEYWIR